MTGEWKYDNTIWYMSELTLQSNGSFKFHNQDCYGQDFTEGQWSYNNGTIILSSFDTFKQVKEIKTKQPDEIEEPEEIKRKMKKGEIEYSFVALKEVPPPVLAGPDDTVRVYFDKVQLKLNNDTLYCIGQNRIISNHKFVRTRNTR